MTNISDVFERRKKCANCNCVWCKKRKTYCTNYYCEDSDCKERNNLCTNTDCEDPDCKDSRCEAGYDYDELRYRYDGTRVFTQNMRGSLFSTLSFYEVEFKGDAAYLCELKTDERLIKIDNSKWEIKYVVYCDQRTGTQHHIKPWNIKDRTYPYKHSSEHSFIINVNPMMKKLSELIFGDPGIQIEI